VTEPTPPFTAGWDIADEEATKTVASAARALDSAIRVANAPTDALHRAAALIDEATSLLTPHRVDGIPMQGRLGPTGQSFNPVDFFPWSPIIGALNPLSADMRLTFDPETQHMSGLATFDAKYSGPPGMVHGGIIALAFDELLGTTNVCLELGGFTGTLSIRYEKPTFIDLEVAMDAFLDRTEGRKVFTVGTMSINGSVTARAEGIFIRTQGWDRNQT